MAMMMPNILDCNMSDCSYNADKECHAMAITVGGTSHECDTFVMSEIKGGVKEMRGRVGACKIEMCRFNESLECSAQEIHVSQHTDHAECDSFQNR